MSMYAELADGRRLEFPDGTDPMVIQRTVKRMVGEAQQVEAAKPKEGIAEAALIGAGRGTDKLVQGVRQAFNWATGDQGTLDKMAADEAEKDRLYKPLQEARPIATGAGELAPALAASMMTGGTSLAGAAAAQALPAALSYGTGEERLKRAAVDGALGAAGAGAGKVLAKVLQPAGKAAFLSDEALEAANRIGYKPTPAQITQNPALGNFENYLSRTPGGAGAMQKVARQNQTALNRAGAKAMGETADTLDEGVFAAAQKRIGGEFGRLSEVTKPKLGDDFVTALENIGISNAQRGPFASKNVDGLIDKGLELAAKGDLDGKAYKQIRTELANQAQTAFRAGDATTGQAYKSVVSALDKAAKESLSDADKAAWDVARKEWAAFKTLTKSNVAEAGDVSAARVASQVRSKGPGLRTGQAQGELADIARLGEKYKGVQNPNSGNMVTNMLTGNIFTGIPLALGNKAAASLYLSPMGQRYFTRGLLDLGDEGASLLGRGGSVLGGAGGRSLLGAE